MISIRQYLVRRLLVAVVGISLTAGIIAWMTTRHEVEELLNHNLDQIAHAIGQEQESLVALNEANKLSTTRAIHSPHRKFNGEDDFFIQIWQGEEEIYHSHELPTFPHATDDGFSQISYQGVPWYAYRLRLEHVVVQVAQPLDMQHEMVEEMVPGMLVPLAIQIPILALLAWFIVGRGLQPLQAISTAISQRNPDLLEPLPSTQAPIEIQPIINELNNLLQRLMVTLHVQRQFTADAAHELRTPLTAVQLQLDILQRAKNDTDRDEAIRKLHHGVQRSIHLVRQLLSMARQEPSQSAATGATADIAAILRDSVEQFTLLANDKQIDLRCEDIEPAHIMADAESIQILINNLLDNAIRYTPADGRVVVSVKQVPEGYCLAVRDNGVGIPPAERERIFDRFYRIAGSATFGTGLGLAIVKRIADAHSATIRVEAGLDQRGTSFIVTFPFAAL